MANTRTRTRTRTSSAVAVPEKIVEADALISTLRKVRLRRALDQISEKRLYHKLQRFIDSGVINQTGVAARLNVSQPAVCKSLKTAVDVTEPPKGFSGTDPYEIASRYALEEIDREQLIDQLSNWAYAPSATTDGLHDDLLVGTAGTFEDVVRAYREGLIDRESYGMIVKNKMRRSGRE